MNWYEFILVSVAGIAMLLSFTSFCMRYKLHRHKFDRTLDAMVEARRFRGAEDAKEFSAGLERAFRAVGDEPKFTPERRSRLLPSPSSTEGTAASQAGRR